jgi:vacuolar-type H+-ATPase subunit E/Vma4
MSDEKNTIISDLCAHIKTTALDPANEEKDKIIKKAKYRAEIIIKDAEKKVKKLVDNANDQIAQKKRSFEEQLNLARKQSIAQLRKDIEYKIIKQALKGLVENELNKKVNLNALITNLVDAFSKHGFSADYTLYLSQHSVLKANDILNELKGEIKALLKDRIILTSKGSFSLSVKMKDTEIECVFDDNFIIDQLDSYLSPEFKQLFTDNDR